MDQNALNKLFKQTQIGRIVNCEVEPITDLYSLDDVKKLFEANPDYSCLPVETSFGTGLVFREEMMHSNKSLFGGGKLEKYIDENPFSCKANEDVFQVLNNLLETGDANPHKDFIVYYKKNYFGVGKFFELIRYVNKLNSIDERSAKELQQFLIDKSKFHNLPFKINTYNKMAHSLGGDFCKTFNVNEDLSLIAIFDVSGKGITGALSTISISAFFSLISRTKEILKDPDTIVAELNNYIHDQTPFSIFITSVLMFIDQKAEKIIIYNLGHTPVLSYEINGAEITMVKIDAGLPPLGIDEELTGLKDGKTELPMSSNRKIVFYSDGLSEATNDYGVRYGEERTEKFFDENIQRENEEIISELQKDMESFLEEAPLTDDITVMISDFEPSVNESIQSKDEPLKTMQYLFKHSFDYSFHLFLNNSGRQEEKMYRCLLLFSAKKERFLIIRRSTDNSHTGYLLTENHNWAFDENREFKQIGLDSQLFHTLLSPLHLKADWLWRDFTVKNQESLENMESSPIIRLQCSPRQDAAGPSQVDILVDEKHQVPFRMTIHRENIEERITSKKWVQYKGEFFPKEFSILNSGEPDSKTKGYFSAYQQKTFDKDLFSVDYLKNADIESIASELSVI